MPNTAQNTPKTPTRTSKIDKAIGLVVQNNPDMSIGQIAKEVKSLGAAQSEKSVFNRWYKKDYRRRDIGDVKRRNAAVLQREILPLAHKALRKGLKSQEVTDHQKAKLGLDAMRIGHPQTIQHDHGDAVVGNVNIAKLVVNTAIQAALTEVSTSEQDVIDVEPSASKESE